MERMRPVARQTGMMSRRQVHHGLIVAAGWGLLGALLAGCGSVAASTAAGGGTLTPAGHSGTAGAAAAAAASATAAPQAGCAGVNQVTMVTVSRLTHLARPSGPLLVIDREPALVRALFRDFCGAVTHPGASAGVVHCPADFGAEYYGAFYDGSRMLATYTYDASGCRQVGLIVGNTNRSVLVAGRAAAAAPHLATDWAAVLDAAKSASTSPSSQVNPGGPDQPVSMSSPSQVNPGGLN